MSINPISEKVQRRMARAEAMPGLAVSLPRPVAQAVLQFLADGNTGNVQINVKDGAVLGCHVEQIVKATGP